MEVAASRSCVLRHLRSSRHQRQRKSSAGGVRARCQLRSHQKSDWRVVQVAPDGNCFFRALAQSSHFNKRHTVLDRQAEAEAASLLRARIVQELEAQRPFFEPFMTVSWQQYIKAMATSGTWGGEPELAAAPAALRAPVHVYRSEALARGVADACIVYGEDWTGQAPPVSVLFYGAHYDALVPAEAPT